MRTAAAGRPGSPRSATVAKKRRPLAAPAPAADSTTPPPWRNIRRGDAYAIMCARATASFICPASRLNVIAARNLVVVMPAYNAERTLLKTWQEVVSHDIVDLVIVVDDASRDGTVGVARNLEKVIVHTHDANRGYGANQKTCYRLALAHGADIVIMIHPDYQYTPRLIPAMAGMVASGLYHCVLASRILGGQALKGGMPLWRYVSNRFLTLAGNLLLGTKVSEFHTGYRAYSRELLERLPLEANSDDFVFDHEVLAQTAWLGYIMGEVSCPTSYAADASSINFRRSVRYGFGCLATDITYRLCAMKLMRSERFPPVKPFDG